MKRYLLILIGLFVLAPVHAENDKAFFWEVRSPTATVYLMGSIHFADNSFYPLRQEIENAYQQSDALVVELDISKIDQQVYNRILEQRGLLENGATIKDAISAETWLQLRQRLRYLDIPYDSVKNYKPGILVLTLSAIQVMKMGFDPQLGIDAYFISKAAQKKLSTQSKAKNIIELETLEQQISLFLNIPNGDLLLKESLHSMEEAELLMAEMVQYWKLGDEKNMNKLLFDDALKEYPAFSAIYDSLFYSRNAGMTDKIEKLLKRSEGSYFVVVGSGHLIGEKGIVNALKENGYEVKRR